MSVAQTDSLPHTFPSLFPHFSPSLMHSHAVSLSPSRFSDLQAILSSQSTVSLSHTIFLLSTCLCYSDCQSDRLPQTFPPTHTFPSLLSTFSLSLSGSRSFFSLSAAYFSLFISILSPSGSHVQSHTTVSPSHALFLLFFPLSTLFLVSLCAFAAREGR